MEKNSLLSSMAQLLDIPALAPGDDVHHPLVVVEVLSPSTIDVDRGDKLRFY